MEVMRLLIESDTVREWPARTDQVGGSLGLMMSDRAVSRRRAELSSIARAERTIGSWDAEPWGTRDGRREEGRRASENKGARMGNSTCLCLKRKHTTQVSQLSFPVDFKEIKGVLQATHSGMGLKIQLYVVVQRNTFSLSDHSQSFPQQLD